MTAAESMRMVLQRRLWRTIADLIGDARRGLLTLYSDPDPSKSLSGLYKGLRFHGEFA